MYPLKQEKKENRKAPDWLVEPTNDTEQTCVIRIDIENLFAKWKQSGKLKFDIEIYDLENSLIQSATTISESPFSFAKRRFKDFLRLIEVNDYPENRFLRYYLGTAISYHAIASCMSAIKGKKNLKSKKQEKEIYRYLAKNEFRLVIECNDNDFCHGVIDQVHELLRTIYKYTGIKHPTPDMLSKHSMPIPTIIPPNFVMELKNQVSKRFLINLEIDGFYEGAGIAGFFSIHDEANLPNQSGEFNLDMDESKVEEILDFFHPWEKKND